MQDSEEAGILRNLRFGTLILDEAHKARVRGGLKQEQEPNNLLAFMREVVKNSKHVLLGTATPIQTDVRELWDLVALLNQGAEFVMGRDYVTSWRDWEKTVPLVTGEEVVSDEMTAWNLLRAPLPARETPMMDQSAARLVRMIRTDLGIPDSKFFTDAAPESLGTRSL